MILLKSRANPEQIAEMLEMLGVYIKLAVDIKREVIVGGGELHADCEEVLLDDGSQQTDIWGADWIPRTKEVRYEAMINIRPRQNNRSLYITDATIRQQVERIARKLLEVA